MYSKCRYWWMLRLSIGKSIGDIEIFARTLNSDNSSRMRLISIALCAMLFGCTTIGENLSDWMPKEDTFYSEDFMKTMLLAKQGDIQSQFVIGMKYDLGMGVPKSTKDAERWYRSAAEKGLAIAQFHLGAMYELGDIVAEKGIHMTAQERSYAASSKWYRRASSQGNKDAEFRLAALAERRHEYLGTQKESPRSRSLIWASLAREGNASAQYRLGLALSESVNPYVLRDAFIWLSVAKINGIKNAQILLDQIEPNIYRSEYCAVELRVASCVESDYDVCDFLRHPARVC